MEHNATTLAATPECLLGLAWTQGFIKGKRLSLSTFPLARHDQCYGWDCIAMRQANSAMAPSLLLNFARRSFVAARHFWPHYGYVRLRTKFTHKLKKCRLFTGLFVRPNFSEFLASVIRPLSCQHPKSSEFFVVVVATTSRTHNIDRIRDFRCRSSLPSRRPLIVLSFSSA